MRTVIKFILLCFTPFLLIAPALAQEATPEASTEPAAYYRYANFAPGTSVVFTSDQNQSTAADTTPLEYKAFSEWSPVTPGKQTLAVHSTGDNAVQSEPVEVDFADGGWYTLAAIGTPQGALQFEPITETYDPLLPGTSWLTFANAVQGDVNVDFIRDGSTYTANLFSLGNTDNQTSWFGIMDDVDTYDFQVVENGNSENVLADAPDTELRENELYLITAVGTSDPNDDYDVELLVENTDMSEIALVKGEMQQPGTIIDAAKARPELSSWLQAVDTAGLTETLSGEGPYTVFVPADFVMDNLPDDVRNNPDTLKQLLQSEIVQGDLRSQDIFSTDSLTTLAGSTLTVDATGENAFVNDAQLIDVNIPATNGEIHIVNGFVVPPDQLSQ